MGEDLLRQAQAQHCGGPTSPDLTAGWWGRLGCVHFASRVKAVETCSRPPRSEKGEQAFESRTT